MTPEQVRAAEEFRQLRGVEPFGPFITLLQSPELMTRVSALGEYLRFRSALPPRLSELAILITAAHWRQQYEWDVHAPIAVEAGIPRSVLDAVWKGEAPDGLDIQQQAVHDLSIAVHRDRTIFRALHDRAQAALGEQGTIDAIAICGYYALLAMVLNAQK
ncbi:MAG: carboxymuconolactone decarboxylase family protein [Vicinamibacterales bacterium]